MASPLEAAIRRRALESPLGIVSGQLLIIAAHRDDETLGCGAITSEILKKGGSVCVVIVTDGEASRSYSDRNEVADIRRAEASSAADTLGIGAENVHWLNLADGGISPNEAEMTSVLKGLAEVWEPNVVLTNASTDPHPHPDDAAVGKATRRALLVTRPALFEYLIWGRYQPWAWLRSLAAAHDIPASGAELPFSTVKIRSLSGLE
jgi:LmbE family N-acetylglucosaminyl deacetylase